MTIESAPRRARRPRGVIALVVAFYVTAGLVVLSAVATGDEKLPSDISAVITIYLLVLAWGLWKLYRWAWFATLIMFLLSTFSVLSNGALLNTPVGWPLLFIAICASYLLWPDVRRVYLKNGWERQEPEHDDA